MLGQLTEQQERELLNNAAQYVEIHDALNEAEHTLFLMGKKDSVAPPVSAKRKLFNKLNLEAKLDEDITQEDTLAYSSKSDSISRTINLYPYFSAVASIIAIIGIVLSIYYRNQWQETESQLSQIIVQNQSMAQQYSIVKNQLDQYAANIEVLRQPGLETVPMKGMAIAPNAQAIVHWNKQTKEVYLNAKKMPSNEIDVQYQLWAIVDGAPVDMGVFDVAGDMTTLLKMKDIEKAAAFAVTLEPRGGSENPTMEQLYVMGQI